jgi:hypothetical protein
MQMKPGIALWMALVFTVLVSSESYALDKEDISKKLEELTQKNEQIQKEMESLKKQLQELKTDKSTQDEKIAAQGEKLQETAEKTKGLSRFDVWGDFRFKVDSIHAKFDDFTGFKWNTAAYRLKQYESFNADDDTLMTNRLRFNLKAKAAEDVDFTGRFIMYKIWGSESSTPLGANGFMPQNTVSFDGNAAHRPQDNAMRVDRAYVNWYEPFGFPGNVSIGRRPSAGGPPLNLKEGIGRDGVPAGLGIDYAFDGLVVLYKPEIEMLPGFKTRLCIGKGFESGLRDDNINNLKDSVFAGFNFDLYDNKETGTLVEFQIFRAFNVNDLPENATANIGGVDHVTGLYMTRTADVDWFISSGLSITHPADMSGWGIPVDWNGDGTLGAGDTYYPGGLLSDSGSNAAGHSGYALYAGFRAPYGKSKFGMEYNYGSKYWVNFTSASDDIFGSKLAARGHVAEAYWMYELTKEPVWKLSKVLFRLGYQRYIFEYGGSGLLLGEPKKLDENPRMFYPSPKTMDNIYTSFDVYF